MIVDLVNGLIDPAGQPLLEMIHRGAYSNSCQANGRHRRQ